MRGRARGRRRLRGRARRPGAGRCAAAARRWTGSRSRTTTPAADGVRLRRRPRIAVLYAVGTIVSGRSGFDATDGDLVGSDSIVEDIRRIRDDRSIRGIVLRIDSPGGSSVASDVILRELMLTQGATIPSGRSSCRCRISRRRAATTSRSRATRSWRSRARSPARSASTPGRSSTAARSNKVGVTAEAVLEGANADIYSPLSPFTPAQREQVARLHAGLLQRASSTRRPRRARRRATRSTRWRRAECGPARRPRSAAWWIGWAGSTMALAAVKERAGMRPDDAVETVVYPRRRTFYEALSDQFGGASSGVSLVRALGGARGPGARDRVGHRAGAPVPPRRAAGADAVCVREVGSGLRAQGSGLRARTSPAASERPLCSA